MNYIKRLERDNSELKDRIAGVSYEVDCMLQYLSSGKFRGTENGESKDYIRTWEVEEFCRRIRTEITE